MRTTPADPLAAAAARALPDRDDAAAEAVEKFALRTRSPLAADTVALAASGGTHDLASLLEDLRAGGTPGLDPVWGAATARLLALGPRPDARERGTEVFEALVRRVPAHALGRRAATTWAQLLLRSGRDDELRALLADEDDPLPLSNIDRWGLRADLANPWRTDASPTPAVDEAAELAWLEVLNEVHAADGLEPVRLAPTGATPYQRLTAEPGSTVDGELVTVVMSAYRPDHDILAAVRSVLAQSWTNVELLVVDDASPPGSEALLEEVAGLDERVRVVRAPRNGGTYEARNLALRTARGRWMTFHDSDDWTHPRRVEVQVQALQDRRGLLSCRTWTLRAYPDLTLTYVGYPPERLNASSLLVDRLETTRLVGAFDATRKSADMELPLRLNAVRPGSHRDVRHPAPLAITQLRGGSLSRTDAVPGWTRWTRLAYRDLYLEWHRRIAAGRADAVLPAARRPFPLPDPAWAPDPPRESGPRTHELVVLGDLRAEQPSAGRTSALAVALAATGRTTALAHGEVPDPLATRRPDLLPAAVAAVSDGRLALTDVDEPDEVALLVVDGPAALLHLPGGGLSVGQVLVVADAPPSAAAGWSVAAVDARCQELFGRLPRWGGPLGRWPGLREELPADRLLDADLLPVVDPAATCVGRGNPALGRPTGPPVVGHHLPDRRARWPRSADDIRAAYPEDGLDVRLLHGAATPTRALRRTLPPPSWLSLAGTGMTSREFLSHLDVFVYQGEWDVTAEVAALEALAAGLPCVLPAPAATAGLAPPDDTDGAVPAQSVRCVEPAGVHAATAELLEIAGTQAARARDAAPTVSHPHPASATPHARLQTWAEAVRSLTTVVESPRGARA
ncbi:glycosyltransferase family 2 protein [Ornithinimicrobium pekingense]|uniref:Glycosyltransferase 2-like domain-containing protein n=1 Tax=Ornithinimicrobium pekingense TaxID=384677 RepID=A0ABQ2F926_9MICO|nr:glycosyltransferase family 2 protein [Ornithinimicrobium pekingense]GGK73519.1 hypothetical protein GCM10011509_22650 [Ornithinimicrobium pekingense]